MARPKTAFTPAGRKDRKRVAHFSLQGQTWKLHITYAGLSLARALSHNLTKHKGGREL